MQLVHLRAKVNAEQKPSFNISLSHLAPGRNKIDNGNSKLKGGLKSRNSEVTSDALVHSVKASASGRNRQSHTEGKAATLSNEGHTAIGFVQQTPESQVFETNLIKNLIYSSHHTFGRAFFSGSRAGVKSGKLGSAPLRTLECTCWLPSPKNCITVVPTGCSFSFFSTRGAFRISL